MQISADLAIAVTGIMVTQGAAMMYYVSRAARYVGSVDSHLATIDTHLRGLNGRVDKIDQAVDVLEDDPKWLERTVTLANQITYISRQTQALLQDVNERRIREGLPSLQMVTGNDL